MPFKFEQLEVWQLSVAYIDLMYKIAEQLPRSEEFNLKSQMLRAATSAALNIAEGSTGQSDPEQRTFLGYSLRSLLETVACQFLISRRGYLSDSPYFVRHINRRRLWRASCSPCGKRSARREGWHARSNPNTKRTMTIG